MTLLLWKLCFGPGNVLKLYRVETIHSMLLARPSDYFSTLHWCSSTLQWQLNCVHTHTHTHRAQNWSWTDKTRRDEPIKHRQHAVALNESSHQTLGWVEFNFGPNRTSFQSISFHFPLNFDSICAISFVCVFMYVHGPRWHMPCTWEWDFTDLIPLGWFGLRLASSFDLPSALVRMFDPCVQCMFVCQCHSIHCGEHNYSCLLWFVRSFPFSPSPQCCQINCTACLVLYVYVLHAYIFCIWWFFNGHIHWHCDSIMLWKWWIWDLH